MTTYRLAIALFLAFTFAAIVGAGYGATVDRIGMLIGFIPGFVGMLLLMHWGYVEGDEAYRDHVECLRQARMNARRRAYATRAARTVVAYAHGRSTIGDAKGRATRPMRSEWSANDAMHRAPWGQA
jgi:hypothetical protein